MKCTFYERDLKAFRGCNIHAGNNPILRKLFKLMKCSPCSVPSVLSVPSVPSVLSVLSVPTVCHRFRFISTLRSLPLWVMGYYGLWVMGRQKLALMHAMPLIQGHANTLKTFL